MTPSKDSPMIIAEWRDEYSTGHAAIDQQHRHLFSLVNQIYAMTQVQPQPRAAMRERLEEFARCAADHFELEERLMVDYAYPNYNVHCGTHQALVNKVQSLLSRLERQPQPMAGDVTQVLADWMVHHIRGEDQQMIRFFRSRQGAAVGSSAVPG